LIDLIDSIDYCGTYLAYGSPIVTAEDNELQCCFSVVIISLASLFLLPTKQLFVEINAQDKTRQGTPNVVTVIVRTGKIKHI
jgi:hypothetical protein